MKAPERLLSTPRLIAIIITVALVGLTFNTMVEPKDFVAIATLILGYFFGSRGSEKADGKTETELKYKTENEVKAEIQPTVDNNIRENI